MATLQDFRLPDVGEGLTEAEILAWKVAPGDPIEVNQIILEIETAKAVVELPCPYRGVVSAMHVRAGETVPVGTVIITIETAQDAHTAPDRPYPNRRESRSPGRAAATRRIRAAVE